ncbi:glycosyltransferase family 4 protein, partial [Paratractidigestivibacter sp.]|uniref:glycosyltransferase family 4 protein n=1 Tax=Paratractidigestivibacter sp. TaxID=2847316 RepID=UPI002AC8A9C5
GGSETYHFAVGESLEAAGCDVAWFAMEDLKNLPCKQSKYFVSASDYNGKTKPLKKVKDGLSLIYSVEAKDKFNALLEEFQPDVIHMNLVHRQLTFSILDASYLKKHPVPVVYTAHDYIPICPACTMLDGEGDVCDDCLGGSFTPCVRKRCVKGSRAKSMLAVAEASFIHRRGSYKKIDRIIAPSNFMRSKLLEGGFPAEQVLFMQNFAKDSVLANAREAEDRTDWENPYLLFFGRLSREKGIDVLVDAFCISIPSLPENMRLVIAGDGPERAAIEEKLSAMDAASAKRVELVGFQQGEVLRNYVERASLAIASSRCRENMPYSIVEAFALGTPVVGTNIGGIPELVIEGQTGFLAEPDDIESLSEAISRGVEFCNDKDRHREMQTNCKNYVLEHCDQDTYMQQLITLYQELIDSKKEIA